MASTKTTGLSDSKNTITTETDLPVDVNDTLTRILRKSEKGLLNELEEARKLITKYETNLTEYGMLIEKTTILLTSTKLAVDRMEQAYQAIITRGTTAIPTPVTPEPEATTEEATEETIDDSCRYFYREPYNVKLHDRICEELIKRTGETISLADIIKLVDEDFDLTDQHVSTVLRKLREGGSIKHPTRNKYTWDDTLDISAVRAACRKPPFPKRASSRTKRKPQTTVDPHLPALRVYHGTESVDQCRVLTSLYHGGEQSFSELRFNVECSSPQLTATLSALLDKGLIVSGLNSCHATYRINPNYRPTVAEAPTVGTVTLPVSTTESPVPVDTPVDSGVHSTPAPGRGEEGEGEFSAPEGKGTPELKEVKVAVAEPGDYPPTEKQLEVLEVLKEKGAQGAFVREIQEDRFPDNSYASIAGLLKGLRHKGLATYLGPGKYRAAHSDEPSGATNTNAEVKYTGTPFKSLVPRAPNSKWGHLVPIVMTQYACERARSLDWLAGKLRNLGYSTTNNAFAKNLTKLIRAGKVKRLALGSYRWIGDNSSADITIPLPYTRIEEECPDDQLFEKEEAERCPLLVEDVDQEDKPLLDSVRNVFMTGEEWSAHYMLQYLHALGKKEITLDEVQECFHQLRADKLIIKGYGYDYYLWADKQEVALKKAEAAVEVPPKEEAATNSLTDINKMSTKDVILQIFKDAPNAQLTPNQILLGVQQLGYQRTNYHDVSWNIGQLTREGVLISPKEGWFRLKRLALPLI